jgi:predicted lipoprotein with Yx(FWY)xxD motif
MSLRLWVSTAAVAAFATACSSSGSGGGAYGGGGNGGSSAPAGGSSTVAISVNNDRLTAPDGMTLYYNTVDTTKDIQCVGGCAGEWPPLLGKPEAGHGLDEADFATVTRPDGTTQVTFYGHPLYEFSQDAAGDAKGNGAQDSGGHWVVATPQQAEQGGGATSSTPSSSGGYSGGY